MGSIHTEPGAEGQVDDGQGPLVKDVDGVYRRTRLFAMTLGWSRKALWRLSMSSSLRCGARPTSLRAASIAAEQFLVRVEFERTTSSGVVSVDLKRPKLSGQAGCGRLD